MAEINIDKNTNTSIQCWISSTNRALCWTMKHLHKNSISFDMQRNTYLRYWFNSMQSDIKIVWKVYAQSANKRILRLKNSHIHLISSVLNKRVRKSDKESRNWGKMVHANCMMQYSSKMLHWNSFHGDFWWFKRRPHLFIPNSFWLVLCEYREKIDRFSKMYYTKNWMNFNQIITAAWIFHQAF